MSSGCRGYVEEVINGRFCSRSAPAPLIAMEWHPLGEASLSLRCQNPLFPPPPPLPTQLAMPSSVFPMECNVLDGHPVSLTRHGVLVYWWGGQWYSNASHVWNRLTPQTGNLLIGDQMFSPNCPRPLMVYFTSI